MIKIAVETCNISSASFSYHFSFVCQLCADSHFFLQFKVRNVLQFVNQYRSSLKEKTGKTVFSVAYTVVTRRD